MKASNKLTLLFFSTLVFSICVLFYNKKNHAINIITQTQDAINEQIDSTKQYINKEIKKITRERKIKKSKVISVAKKIQKNINNTSENISEDIKENINQISEKNCSETKKIKDIVNSTKQSIKRELKIAYKKIRGQAVRMLREKKKDKIIGHAKKIQITTDETSNIIKQNINDAFEAIKSV